MEIKDIDKNVGYILDDVPVHIIEQLKNHIQDINLPRANEDLAGNIKNEYYLPNGPDILEQYILSLVNIYEERYNHTDNNYSVLTENLQLKLKSVWVNFQQKHEFNPVHTHTGLFSFVIWVQIPYTKENELDAAHSRTANTKASGAFSFIYPDTLGNIKSEFIHADKNYEGRIAFFPAKLAHCVYPFYTSDEERITVSGNIAFNSQK